MSDTTQSQTDTNKPQPNQPQTKKPLPKVEGSATSEGAAEAAAAAEEHKTETRLNRAYTRIKQAGKALKTGAEAVAYANRFASNKIMGGLQNFSTTIVGSVANGIVDELPPWIQKLGVGKGAELLTTLTSKTFGLLVPELKKKKIEDQQDDKEKSEEAKAEEEKKAKEEEKKSLLEKINDNTESSNQTISEIDEILKKEFASLVGEDDEGNDDSQSKLERESNRSGSTVENAPTGTPSDPMTVKIKESSNLPKIKKEGGFLKGLLLGILNPFKKLKIIFMGLLAGAAIIGTTLALMLGKFKPILSVVFKGIEAVGSFLFSVIEKSVHLAEKGYETVSEFFKSAVEFFKNGYDSICKFFESAVEFFKTGFETVGDLVGTFFKSIKSGFSTIGTFFTSFFDKIKNIFEKIGSFFKSVFSGGIFEKIFGKKEEPSTDSKIEREKASSPEQQSGKKEEPGVVRRTAENISQWANGKDLSENAKSATGLGAKISGQTVANLGAKFITKKVIGALFGAAAGALGTIVAPGVGTAVGSAAGYAVGELAGDALVNAGEKVYSHFFGDEEKPQTKIDEKIEELQTKNKEPASPLQEVTPNDTGIVTEAKNTPRASVPVQTNKATETRIRVNEEKAKITQVSSPSTVVVNNTSSNVNNNTTQRTIIMNDPKQLSVNGSTIW
jgi:uncharacterized protein (DUF697 family)